MSCGHYVGFKRPMIDLGVIGMILTDVGQSGIITLGFWLCVCAQMRVCARTHLDAPDHIALRVQAVPSPAVFCVRLGVEDGHNGSQKFTAFVLGDLVDAHCTNVLEVASTPVHIL